MSTSSRYFSSRAKAKEIFSKFYSWLLRSSWIPICNWLNGREKRSVQVFKSDPQIIWNICQNVRFMSHPINSRIKKRGGWNSINPVECKSCIVTSEASSEKEALSPPGFAETFASRGINCHLETLASLCALYRRGPCRITSRWQPASTLSHVNYLRSPALGSLQMTVIAWKTPLKNNQTNPFSNSWPPKFEKK